MTRPGRTGGKLSAFIACCAMGAGGVPSFADDTVSGQPEVAARFDFVEPCPFPTGAVEASRVRCGFLDVPENRAQPSAARVRIPVVRIGSAAADAADDPVVFLHGGPGAAPLESARTIERFSQHPFAARRDIILFNQRGSAQTEPALTCAALSAGRVDIYAADLTLAQRDAQIAAAAVQCLREIAAQGRDLAAYGAAAAAADLKDLREALHIERWNLLAVSYGTLIALEAARVDPQGVRSMILDSIVSPRSDLFITEGPRNFSLGLDRLLDACADDATCAVDFPDLRRQLRELLAALERQPIAVTVAGEGGRGSVEIIVNWHDFLGAVHWMMYNAQSLRLVPLLIERTQRGDLRLLTHVMDQIFPAPRNGPGGASPAFFAFVCRDQFTADRPRHRAPANPVYRDFSIVSFMDEVCAKTIAHPQSRNVSLRSTVPALLLSGRFDPMTPELYVQEAAAGLPNAIRFTAGDNGHSTLSDFAGCTSRLAVSFIDALALPVPACVPAQARPVFERRTTVRW